MSAVLGPFVLHEIIGRGGMGEVWSGNHVHQGTPVAVKILRGEKARDRGFLSAFQHEVRSMAGLHHRNICAIYDHGTVGASPPGGLTPGSPWLAMERADGSLEARIGHFDWPDLRRLLIDVLDALSHAHARGVIHRDIKPANLLILDGVVRLADFGIAHAGEDLLGVASSAGTLQFMAPEQLDGAWRDFGPGTDLFAFACTVWLLVCGYTPHSPERLIQHRIGSAPALRPFRPLQSMPAGLESWLNTLLLPEVSRRPLTAAHAALALQQLDDASLLPAYEALVDDFEPEQTQVWESVLTSHLPWQPHAALSADPLPQRADAGASLLAVEHPLLPRDWRRDASSHSHSLRSAGLGLYGLREAPLIGREAERDALWNALSVVSVSGGVRGVILEGEAGVGKSRLARWLLRRAAECGVATGLVATHSHSPAAADGLVDMLNRHLRTQRLPRPEVAERVARLLYPESPRDIGALTELLCPLGREEPSQGVLPVPLKTAAQRQAVLLDALAALSAAHPLVLWLDDVRWSSDTLEVARLLLESTRHNILLVMTSRIDASRSPDDPLAALAAQTAAEHHLISTLSAIERSLLVEELLGLSGGLVSQVAERTGGNPLFATQLIGDWVERGILVAEEGGFVLAEGAKVPIPDAIHELWTGRVERALSGLPGSARTALDLAALLGGEVDDEEWVESCAAASIPADRAVIDRLLEQGLAQHRQDGWAFTHGMLAESIVRIAGEQERLTAAALAVGETLMARGQRLYERGDALNASGGLSRAEGMFRMASSPHRWAAAAVLSARARMDIGLMARAREALCDALSTAREVAVPPVQADALRALGTLHRIQSRSEEAGAHYTAALSIYRDLGDRYGEGETLGDLGMLHKLDGRFQEAGSHYTAALSIHRDLGNRPGEGRVLSSLGSLLLKQKRFQEAGSHYTAALSIHRDLGNRYGEGVVQGNLGVLSKSQGRLQEAQAHYTAALSIHRNLGNRRDEGIVHGNLGNLCLLEGRVADAIVSYTEAMKIFRALGSRRNEALLLSNLGDLERKEGHQEAALSHYRDALRISRALEKRRNVGRLCGRIGHLHLRRGEAEPARTHLQEAVAIYQELGFIVGEGTCRGALGTLLAGAGDIPAARTELRAAEALLRSRDAAARLGQLLCRRCEIERMAGDREAALAALLEAEQLARTASEPALEEAIAAERSALLPGGTSDAGSVA